MFVKSAKSELQKFADVFTSDEGITKGGSQRGADHLLQQYKHVYVLPGSLSQTGIV